MTQTENKPTTPAPRAVLPVWRVDYAAGRFVNTMTGETAEAVEAVVLNYREDRVLWGEWTGLVSLPQCVNGDTDLGPCETCDLKDWRGSEPPSCTEELSLLLSVAGSGLGVLTARRSMMRPVEQWVGMMAATGLPLHAQKVSIGLLAQNGRNGDALHRLTLRPGDLLTERAASEMRQLRDRAQRLFDAIHESD